MCNKEAGGMERCKAKGNVKLIFAFSRWARYEVSNMLQNKNIRFAFILGTETDADPQTETETGVEFGSDRDYEISYKIKVKVKQSRYRPGVAQRVPGS
jgi:hypothetical protein